MYFITQNNALVALMLTLGCILPAVSMEKLKVSMDHFNDGKAHFENKVYEKALACFLKAIETSTARDEQGMRNHARAYCSLNHFLLGNIQEAFAAFDTSLYSGQKEFLIENFQKIAHSPSVSPTTTSHFCALLTLAWAKEIKLMAEIILQSIFMVTISKVSDFSFDPYLPTLLHIACALPMKFGKYELVQYLCEHGTDVNAVNESGYTPLYFAINRGAHRIMKCLLRHGALVNKVYERLDNQTVLHMAAQLGDLKAVKLLIKHNALSLKDTLGRTPTDVARTQLGFAFAKKTDHAAIVEFLENRAKNGFGALEDIDDLLEAIDDILAPYDKGALENILKETIPVVQSPQSRSLAPTTVDRKTEFLQLLVDTMVENVDDAAFQSFYWVLSSEEIALKFLSTDFEVWKACSEQHRIEKVAKDVLPLLHAYCTKLPNEKKMICLLYLADVYMRALKTLEKAYACLTEAKALQGEFPNSPVIPILSAYLGQCDLNGWGIYQNVNLAHDHFVIARASKNSYAQAIATEGLGRLFIIDKSGKWFNHGKGHRLLKEAMEQTVCGWAAQAALDFLSPTRSAGKMGQIDPRGAGRLPTYDDFCFGPLPQYHRGSKK